MRIGIEAQRLFRTRKHGMDVVALETLKALQQLDNGDEYVLFVRPGPDRDCLTASHNLRVVEVRAPNFAVWEQVCLPRAVEAAGVDLLHCTANTGPLFSPVPTVVTLHDVIFMEGPAGGNAYQRWGNRYRRWVVPRLARRARRVVTVSEYERGQILERLPGVAGVLEVVHNGVGAIFWRRDDPNRLGAVRERYALPERFVFYLGNVAPKKNLPNVLAAYGHYCRGATRPVPLVIADLDRHRLDAELERLELSWLSQRIHLPGYIGHAELPAVYSQCAAFLYPSLRESFGLPILEAMACGAPVITSEATAMPEIAGQAAMLVDPRDPRSISAGLRRLLGDADLALALHMSGLRRAAGFTWTATARRLTEIYHGMGSRRLAGRIGEADLDVRPSRLVGPTAAFVEIPPTAMNPLPNLPFQ